MFVVEVGAALTTVFVDPRRRRLAHPGLASAADRPLALVHGAVRELRRGDGRGARQGAGRRAAQDQDRRCSASASWTAARPRRSRRRALRAGDVVLCEAGDIIPGDGEVIEGIASVDESVITGESAPVIRESGGDRSAVTGGTRVLSDWIKVRITSNPGETFLDRMIALVEGAQRQKTPNEIALNILIAGLTLIFLLAVATLQPYAAYSVSSAGAGTVPTVAVLVSLLVCLIPTTIGGLLSAIGIAGMDRVMQHNVLAMSGSAVEASGDVHTLLLDKTGTITLGNRQAVVVHPARRRRGARPGRRGAARQPGGRDAGRAVDRRAGEGALPVPRPRGRGDRRRVHSVLRVHAHERRRSRRPAPAQGRVRRDCDLREGAGRLGAVRVRGSDGAHFAHRRHAAGRRGRPEAPRPDSPQGRRQGRHQGAHRAAPADGHPLGDDHRRQPAHGRGHRQRGGRRRLPGAGHAEGQARVHPQGTGAKAASSR